MKYIKRIYTTYKYLLGIIYKETRLLVIIPVAASVVSGFLSPLTIYVQGAILDGGMAVAAGTAKLIELAPMMILLVITALAPRLYELYTFGYVEQRTLLILRSVFRGRMLEKIKTMKYEHFESEASMEVIDKAYSRAENSARHLYPMYLTWNLASLVGAVGSLIYLGSVRWWLVPMALGPFVIETYFSSRSSFNIYNEIESYWKQENKYNKLAGYLRNRDYVRENKLNQSSDFLIDTYRKRFNKRNKQYEAFYFKHLKRQFTKNNIFRLGQIAVAVSLLLLNINGGVSLGLMTSLTLAVFGSFRWDLLGSIQIFTWGTFHFNFFDYYNKYFELSDENAAKETDSSPSDFSVAFRDVWFRYPGTERDILKGLTFTVASGEKVSIVGANGEGKSTMAKLLLGLFSPDKGEILVGGKPLASISRARRVKLFGAVFQDFSRYSVSLKENVAVGDIDRLNDDAALLATMRKTGVLSFAEGFKDGVDTLFGKEFEYGADLSGGQWQRIAMARAFFGDKPILILDEPTSQLDPMAESRLYGEFAEMSGDKTALFITHRLGSTAITDRILVIADGVVAESGSHDSLINTGGIYAAMFDAQKHWYGGEARG